MNGTIALLLLQDGLTSGFIYALLALSILIVFVVTRVLWVPAGEFLVFGALTLAMLQQGRVPGTVWLVGGLGILTGLLETWRAWRLGDWRGWPGLIGIVLGVPLLAGGAIIWLAPVKPHLLIQIVLTLALLTPMGFMLYRIAFRALADRSTLLLMFVAIALHYALTGLGLAFFGPEGYRTPVFIPGRIDVGVTRISWQLVLVITTSIIVMSGFWIFMGRTLMGAALRATAVNRFGARLVGIRTEAMGGLVFSIAALLGAFSGVLIGPVTSLFYDSGFIISLKGFVGTVIAGMVSFPLSVLGAIMIGAIESFASFYASSFKDAIVFALLIPFLLWRSAIEAHNAIAHAEEE